MPSDGNYRATTLNQIVSDHRLRTAGLCGEVLAWIRASRSAKFEGSSRQLRTWLRIIDSTLQPDSGSLKCAVSGLGTDSAFSRHSFSLRPAFQV